MRRLEIEDAEIMSLAVQNEISRSEEARYDHRLHGILLICRGFNCYDVASLLGQTPQTIENWVKRFNVNGFAGLWDKTRSGRPSKLGGDEIKQIGKDLRRNPTEFRYTQNLWDGKLLSYHLEQIYHTKLSVRHCQRLFHKLDFRRRKPRGVIANADPVKKENFKKN